MRVFNYSMIKNLPFRLNIFFLYFFIFEAKLSANSYRGDASLHINEKHDLFSVIRFIVICFK